jgi:phage terminase small subunit
LRKKSRLLQFSNRSGFQMAGVKGRSGGARAGAGRKPKPIAQLAASSDDPVEFLREVMQDKKADPKLRVRAAIAAAQYTGARRGSRGKKDGQQDAAQQASKGRFAPSEPPKLAVVPKAS